MDMSLPEIIIQIRINATIVEKIIQNKPLADQMLNWAKNLDELVKLIEDIHVPANL